VLADVTRILAEKDISIEAIIQKEPLEGSDKATVIILTHRILENNMNALGTSYEEFSRAYV
jgi:homoserine dehydrogenase